jgi:hypothetical protein
MARVKTSPTSPTAPKDARASVLRGTDTVAVLGYDRPVDWRDSTDWEAILMDAPTGRSDLLEAVQERAAEVEALATKLRRRVRQNGNREDLSRILAHLNVARLQYGG